MRPAPRVNGDRKREETKFVENFTRRTLEGISFLSSPTRTRKIHKHKEGAEVDLCVFYREKDLYG